MHVLVLANRLPFPVDDGWKMRTYHLLRGFAQHATVTLLAYSDDEQEVIDAFRSSLGGDIEVITVAPPKVHSPARLAAGLLTSTPLQVWNVRTRRFGRAVRELAARRSFDVAVAELTYMYPYLQLLPRSTRRIIDTHNVDSVVLRRFAGALPSRPRRLYSAATAGKLEAFERAVFADADMVWVCSDEDGRLARTISPSAHILTVPNGVDTRAVAPMSSVRPRPERLLFFGRMDYEPNRDAVHYFAQSILPELRKLGVDVELHVVGAGIDGDLERRARDTPEIHLAGRVDDLLPALAKACIVVVPLRMGGGTRLKILEALSAGKAVVSTSLGAEGLDLTDGHDVLLADSPEAFARAVRTLLEDDILRQRLGENGRATVQKLYDWSTVHHVAAGSLGWLASPGSTQVA
jgi:polysaccharide biosynthesis protein PslH